MVPIGRLVGLGLGACVLSAIVINLFPGVSASNHQFMLDFPALAAVGLVVLLNWRSRPGMVHSLVVGIILGLCIMVKQVAAIFLLGPGLFLVIEALLEEGGEQRRSRLVQLPSALHAGCVGRSPLWSALSMGRSQSGQYWAPGLTNNGASPHRRPLLR